MAYDELKAFMSKTERRGTCLVWIGGKNGEYGVFKSKRYGNRSMGAHRYSYMVANNLDHLDREIMVRHGLGCTKDCVEPSHLREGSAAQNQLDQYATEDNKPYVLTETMVSDIRSLCRTRIGIAQAVLKYPELTLDTMHRIITLKIWNKLPSNS